MPEILDQYGKPINRKRMQKVYNPGNALTTGFLSSTGKFCNPDKLSFSEYERMLADETCSSGVEFVILATISRIGEYVHPDQKISDFVNEQFERVYGSLYLLVEEMLTALWAGFSVGEIICDFSNKVQLLDIQFIHPSLITFNLETDDTPMKNRVKNVELNGGLLAGGISEPIPAGKLLIYTHRGKFGNPYGSSRFRSIYADYYFKLDIISSWAKTLEKYGSPTAVAYVEDCGESIIDEFGRKLDVLEYYQKVMESIQGGTSIAVRKGTELQFLQNAKALGSDFFQAVEYCNKMIYRGLLIPSLLESGEKGGSRALGSIHFELFVLALQKLKRDVTEVLLDQLVRKLIDWNFGPQTNYGDFAREEFDPDTAKILSEIFVNMTNAGYLTPQNYSDMSFIREKIGAPGIPESDWQKQRDERQKKADAIAAGLTGKEGVVDEKSPNAPDGKNQADKKDSVKEEKLNGILNGLSTFGGDYDE